MEFHEIANIFPMMTPAEYDQLKADILANGLLEPIILYDGFILDGRNRYMACKDLGIEPDFDTVDSDPLTFVISKNLHRRHLNETQRAVVASKLANMQRGERTDLVSIDTKLSLENASKLLNVGRASTARVREIERKAPELISKLDIDRMYRKRAGYAIHTGRKGGCQFHACYHRATLATG